MPRTHGDFWKRIDALLDMAIEEDIGAGDATSDALVPVELSCSAVFTAREAGVMAGGEVIERFFGRFEPKVAYQQKVKEGHQFGPGGILATVEGPAVAILSGERIALNILQRMCGIATLTHRYVKAIEGTNARIVDTRKTVPGWRALDKLAVYLGGADNHRTGLYDMILIKDNHLTLAERRNADASAAWAVRTARQHSTLKIQVEVESPEQLEQVLPEEPEMVLLDNMDVDSLRGAVRLATSVCRERNLRRPLLEASGGVTLQTVGEIARAGVDRISVGALTHSVRALDIGLDIEA